MNINSFKERRVIMLKRKANKIKAALAGVMVAVTAVAAPLPAAFTQKELPMAATAADTDNYAKLLQYSMYFYDANMCGNAVSETTGLDWRSDCHTGDDADGGFHDAGDHAMFGLPQGFTASTLGWSYYEFKDSYTKTGQGAHLQTITDYFCKFFKASTVLDGSGGVSNFCYQKASGITDHDYWGPPENQGKTRKQYWTSNGASDIAAEYAAALALNYLNFGNEEDLTYAKALYKFSTQYNQIAVDGPIEGDQTFYKNTSCTDEQAWAAGWLYMATKEESYKTDCANKQQQYIGWVHGWENVGLGAACVYAHITNDWSKVNSYLSGQCTDPNSYYFLNKWGSARLNASMQMTAMIATKNSSADYSAWCKGQMNYLLGNNPANTCFVIGFADNSAKNPHHRAASGYNSYNELGNNTVTGPNGHSLIGALVGGPTDAGGTYTDSLADYVANEVACDYNAGLVGAAAGLYDYYGTGSVESSIPGVTKIYTSDTVAPDPDDPSFVETTTTVPEGDGKYTLELNESYNYSRMTEKMIGWEWSRFGIPEGERPIKVEVNITENSSSAELIGTWQGAFGSSTSVEADGYWIQSQDDEKYLGDPSGTITWDIDEETSKIIQLDYEGQLKWGVWWIDCTRFIVDSIVVYTTSDGTVEPDPEPEQTTTSNTTPAPETTTTTTTTTPVVNNVKYGDTNEDGEIDVLDIILLNKFLLGGGKLTDQGAKNADVDGNGAPDANDSLNIMKFIVKLIDKLGA